VTRFAGRDAFAASNGTAPMEVSFGKRGGLPAVAPSGTASWTTPSAWLRSTGSAVKLH